MSATKEEIAEFMKSEFPQAKYRIEAVNSSGSILSHVNRPDFIGG